MRKFRMFFGLYGVFLACLLLSACEMTPARDSPDVISQGVYNALENSGAVSGYKIPLPSKDAQGSVYRWQVTQSWGEHCKECDVKYPSATSYCDSTHVTCSSCVNGWDFSLKGADDLGLPVLASANGIVKKAHTSTPGEGWGNYVTINHGNNICTRYAHLQNDSVTVSDGQTVCQGLVIGRVGNTGANTTGPHLHFQFEECSTAKPLAMGFTDGNGVPKCVKNNDVPDEGPYTALKLTNTTKYTCDGAVGSFFPNATKWVKGQCGKLFGCPLAESCNREYNHEFADKQNVTVMTDLAASYLYSECAFDGKSDGGIHPSDVLARAEALKVPLFLFGLMENCGATQTFLDVPSDKWYFPVVACGVKYGIVNVSSYFNPNAAVTFAEAAKFLVESAHKVGFIFETKPAKGHFDNIGSSHWAYVYAETLYSYGAVTATDVKPETLVTRGDYVVMAAALSPCFCANVACDSGCYCDQSELACKTESSASDEPAPESEFPEDNGIPDSGDSEIDYFGDLALSINCYVVMGDITKCLSSDSFLLEIKCKVTNHGEEKAKVSDFEIHLADSEDNDGCEVTKALGVDDKVVRIINPSDTKILPGHFEISCPKFPEDGEVGVEFDMREVSDNGSSLHKEVLPTNISVPEDFALGCSSASPASVDPSAIPESPVPVCVPSCSGKFCGADGCGGSCGTCPTGKTCIDGIGICAASPCTPNCSGKFCGDNGCGGVCGTCPNWQDCTSGYCVDKPCKPYCDGKVCGPDTCGGVCGTCPSGKSCSNGACVSPPCFHDCVAKFCGDDMCGGSCGTCPNWQECKNFKCVDSACKPQCTGKVCGPDACDGSCGNCPSGKSCSNGACVSSPCVPSCQGKTCGSNGCGGSCGTCPSGTTCSGNVCVSSSCPAVPTCPVCATCPVCPICPVSAPCPTCPTCPVSAPCPTCPSCVPSCQGKTCGSDGCGGSCGTCASGKNCINGVCVSPPCVPSCQGKTCGSDGCGGSCGACTGGESCNLGKCVSPEVCNDGVDNDGDGGVDAADSDCAEKVVASVSLFFDASSECQFSAGPAGTTPKNISMSWPQTIFSIKGKEKWGKLWCKAVPIVSLVGVWVYDDPKDFTLQAFTPPNSTAPPAWPSSGGTWMKELPTKAYPGWVNIYFKGAGVP